MTQKARHSTSDGCGCLDGYPQPTRVSALHPNPGLLQKSASLHKSSLLLTSSLWLTVPFPGRGKTRPDPLPIYTKPIPSLESADHPRSSVCIMSPIMG